MTGDGDTGPIRRVLTESADEIVAELEDGTAGGLSARERELAGVVAATVVRRLPGLLRDRPDNLRVAQLETHVRELDAWRLRTSGVGDGDGRLGRMDRAIDRLRADVGTSEERAEERAAAALVNGARRRMQLSAAGAVIAIVGAVYGIWRADHAATAAAARTSERVDARLDHHDVDLDRLFLFCRAPRPDPTRTTP